MNFDWTHRSDSSPCTRRRAAWEKFEMIKLMETSTRTSFRDSISVFLLLTEIKISHNYRAIILFTSHTRWFSFAILVHVLVWCKSSCWCYLRTNSVAFEFTKNQVIVGKTRILQSFEHYLSEWWKHEPIVNLQFKSDVRVWVDQKSTSYELLVFHLVNVIESPIGDWWAQEFCVGQKFPIFDRSPHERVRKRPFSQFNFSCHEFYCLF